MAFHCSDIDTLVQTYLDGELTERDQLDFEEHIAECEECRRKLEEERDFRAELSRQLAACQPQTPRSLPQRVRAALDVEDRAAAAARRRAGWSWVLPGTATLAAAAALVLFLTAGGAPVAEESIAEDAVKAHMRRPPVEVQGASRVSPWIEEHFRADVAVPRFSAANVNLRGARLSHLKGRDAAQLVYEVDRNSRKHELRVHIVDLGDLDVRARDKQVIGGREVWVENRNGYGIVTYKDREGIGYVFTSPNMDGGDLVDLFMSSDLPLRMGERSRER
jgi:anti-sigma factor RsiW